MHPITSHKIATFRVEERHRIADERRLARSVTKVRRRRPSSWLRRRDRRVPQPGALQHA